MKVKTHFIAALLAAGAICPAFSQAPGEQPGAQPPPPAPPPQDGSRRERKGPAFLEKLTPEQRKRFEDARQKALQDPKIKELREKSDRANREFFDAMRAKMQEIDPGLAEIIKENAPNWKGGGGRDMKDGKEGKEGREGREKRPGQGGPGFGNLTDAERQQLLTAREKAKEDPAVMEARKKREAATNPEERQAAGDAYRKAMNEALIKIDPSLGPILKKIEPPAGGPPPPPPAGGNEMGGPPNEMGGPPE